MPKSARPLAGRFETVEKAVAFSTKEMRLDCAHNLFAKGEQIPHLRGDMYVYPQGVRDIRKAVNRQRLSCPVSKAAG